jgi:hypothetical protein
MSEEVMLGTRNVGVVLSWRHDDGVSTILEECRCCLIDVGRIMDERTVTCRMKVRNSDGDGEVITAERIC